MNERDAMLEAVRARLGRVAATRGWTAVLEPSALDEAQRLARCVATPMADLEAEHALGWLFFYRAQALTPDSDWEDALAFFSGCFIAGIEPLPQSLLSTLADRAGPGATNLLRIASQTNDPELVKWAVELWRRILHNIPDGHPNHSAALNNLGNGLEMLGKHTRSPEDLDEAVEVARTTVRITAGDHPDRGVSLTLLANVLLGRFSVSESPADLDECIETARAAIRTLSDDRRVSPLTNLSNALMHRFQRWGVPGDLDEAVEVARVALRAASDDHPDHVILLTNLSRALRHRFESSGSIADLDEGVELDQACVEAMPDRHPGRATALSRLGATLAMRFEITQGLGDLDMALEAQRAAVRATPEVHPRRADQLGRLSDLLQRRLSRSKNPQDLDAAVDAARAAVASAPGNHPEHTAFLTVLGSALLARYYITREPGDVDEATDLLRTALRTVPEDHYARTALLSTFSKLLMTRSLHSGDVSKLEVAVKVSRSALWAVPQGDPRRGQALVNLAELLVGWYKCGGDLSALTEAQSMMEQAVDVATAAPSLRVHAAHAAASLLASSDPGRAADLLERAVLLLPQMAPRRLPRADQQYALARDAASLAADAAALALTDTTGDAQGRAVRALRLAEAGRASLLSQALETRSDMTALRSAHPDLAEHLTELRERFDRESPAGAVIGNADGVAITNHTRHRLATDLDELLRRIRSCEGFAGFGLPPSPEALLAEAEHGPVVTFNVSPLRSDALLLTRSGISSCSLPELSKDAVQDRINVFYRALSEATSPDADRIAAQRTLRETLEWLWEAAVEPVLSALEDMGEALLPGQDDSSLPRVWWVPGGLLGLLPLHAAGFHTDLGPERHRRTVLDRMISSYTPTVRALHYARSRQPRTAGQSLIVAMPTTPGHNPLPHAAEEARRIQARLCRPVQLTEPAVAPDGAQLPVGVGSPTAAAVLARLPQCAIAHFACHGVSDRTDPSQSRLLLHDHATTPLTVSALTQVDLAYAQLAYLSACSTADPGRLDLIDESIHLTSAFQLAGFPHVVGTLWPIDDRLAAEIAESFYTRLTPVSPGNPDPTQSAAALHFTIRAVRDRYPATPSLWAAYLHAGA
ncbi:CHAT domain-containing protein [Streptomyces laculatispora]|uniref:CHAT domain-containing protein n=1 Tax=Streptomyces laculatispora TaxID=887464 RepID=UPI001A93A909|nr:CHAT domain-containing protein [Streptomyces laculatispora]MBO0914952.1 CHAT domain-containing protein [Streptomyces laculatispora]